MGKRIDIDPITRLEGHGKISIFLDDNGDVENAFLQIPEFRGFEKFCEGRPVEEIPRITPRICGVCPTAHHMAGTKAVDAVYGVEVAPTAKKLRELVYNAYMFGDHTLHFYYLGGPDFVVGPTAPPQERNIIGVIAKVGLEVGSEVIKHRKYGQQAIEMILGRPIHPVGGVAGGLSKAFSEEDRQKQIEMAKSAVEFGKFTLKIFDDVVLANKAYVDLILSEGYTMKTHYMGLVDEKNRVNYYDGKVRVVDIDGKEICKYAPSEYLDHIEEHVEPWTYLKFPYLKKYGWKGFVTGKDSGIFRAAPLARLNASEGMNSPVAQEAFDKMYKTLGGKPAHNTLAFHWARVIELMNAAERWLELLQDESITDPHVRNVPTSVPKEGVGIVEAPRGTLTHHYTTDEKGLATKINLIVATVNNNAAICMGLTSAAKQVIQKGEVNEGLLNMIEMCYRAYDPCFACGTHSVGRDMGTVIELINPEGVIVRTLRTK